METAIMKLEDISPADYNPRKTLKPGDQEYEALKNSLDRFGLAEPLIYNKRTGTLISGHQRLNVLKDSGAQEAEVVLVDLDEQQEKLLNIAMNKIEGDWDYKKLETLFSDISAEDIQFTGFTEDELNNLFSFDSEEFDESETEDEEDTSEGQEDSEDGEPQAESNPAPKEFDIFLSFPTKELAEKWLKDRGIDLEYQGTARNITIRMEGLDYGTGNQNHGAE